MSDDNIKSFNLKQTLIANIGNAAQWIVNLVILFWAVDIISSLSIFIEPATQLFAVLATVYLVMRGLRLNYTMVYNQKGKYGGLIRYGGGYSRYG